MRKEIAVAIFVWCFLAFWIFGMVTSLSAKRCRDPLWEGEAFPKACKVHRFGLKVFYAIGQPVKPGEAIFHVSDGLESARNKNFSSAEAYFKKAIALAHKDRDRVEYNGLSLNKTLYRLNQAVFSSNASLKTKALWVRSVSQMAPQFMSILETGKGSND